ncbi:MAG: 50S ribosomal protein L32 [Gammaproteobacteria bacterium]|nr:50S ribosomal protein L32 [Pseudomonadota bacterium]MCH9663707.1 50S ribosomal protein L32 [Gammaproteobacteria bacterium]
MAVQKSRVTRSRRGQRRSHDALKNPLLSDDSVTGEVHYRHHMTAGGFYRGIQHVVKKTTEADQDTDSAE